MALSTEHVLSAYSIADHETESIGVLAIPYTRLMSEQDDDINRLPLAGVTVVAWEQAVAGPLATRHLADLGAQVIKIERPDGGDFARAYDSVVKGLSAHFVWLNRGKRSVVLDLKQPRHRAALERLLDRADVFVHNQGPGVVERLGFGYASLAERNPA